LLAGATNVVAVTKLRLRPLRIDDEATVRAAQEELRADDFTFALFLDDAASWGDYLQRLDAIERGIDVPDTMVRAAFLVADVDGEIVGRTSIRYELNDWLADSGGHIGYGVRPAYRRHGHAAEILRQSLIIVRSHGVGRVLVTCDDDNAGSISTIEGRGGVLDPDKPTTMHDGKSARRYWRH
jgi:predicted acetyltransferase